MKIINYIKNLFAFKPHKYYDFSVKLEGENEVFYWDVRLGQSNLSHFEIVDKEGKRTVFQHKYVQRMSSKELTPTRTK